MREEDYREIKKNPQEFTQFIYLSDLLGEAIALNEVMHEARRLINILYSRNPPLNCERQELYFYIITRQAMLSQASMILR